MLRGIDLICLLYRAMVEPQDHITIVPILVIEVWPSDSDRLICIISKNCKRTCRIEANAANGVSLDIMLVQGSTDR